MRVAYNTAPAMKAMRAAAYRALLDAGEHLGEEANRTVPIEEATLARSMQVSGDPQALKVAVSYDTPYAVRQHEDTRLRHDAGRRAKWLEMTFREEGPRVLRFIADRMRKGGR